MCKVTAMAVAMGVVFAVSPSRTWGGSYVSVGTYGSIPPDVNSIDPDFYGEVPVSLRSPGGAGVRFFQKPPLDDPEFFRTATAIVDPNLSNGLFQMYAGEARGSFFTGVSALATWHDVVRTGFTGDQPDEVLVNFRMHAEFFLYHDHYLNSSIFVFVPFPENTFFLRHDPITPWTENFGPGDGRSGGGVSVFTYDPDLSNPNVPMYFGSSGVTNLQLSHQSFSGPLGNQGWGSLWFNTSLAMARIDDNAYGVNIGVGVWAQAFRGREISMNALNSGWITDVTMLDGTAIEGGYSFDSGYQVPALVPEPSTLLLSLGGIGLLLLKNRRMLFARSVAA
jgi:hypothetical protein